MICFAYSGTSQVCVVWLRTKVNHLWTFVAIVFTPNINTAAIVIKLMKCGYLFLVCCAKIQVPWVTFHQVVITAVTKEHALIVTFAFQNGEPTPCFRTTTIAAYRKCQIIRARRNICWKGKSIFWVHSCNEEKHIMPFYVSLNISILKSNPLIWKNTFIHH